MKHETCNMVNLEVIFYALFQVLCYAFHEKEIVKLNSQIHPQRESSDSPGGFGHRRTEKIDRRDLSKIHPVRNF